MAKVVPIKPGHGVAASQQFPASIQNILKSHGEVQHDLDDSLIDLDYEKNLTTIDPRKMEETKKENHATKANGQYYKCADVCSTFEPGSHYCITSSEKSDLTKFGVGILLYFKYLKHMIFFFFLFILLSIPALVFSVASFQTYNNQSGNLSYLDLLTATTIGSIGLGAASCGLGRLSTYATAGSTENEITFSCTAGEIADASNIIYGIVPTGSTCSFFEDSDLYTACNEYDTTVIVNTFSSCVGEESCTISIPDGMFKSTAECQNDHYKSKYVYIQVACSTTTLILFEGVEIEKTTVAYTVAILDTIIIIVFLLMVYSMKYAQKSASKNVLKKAYSASSYTVQIRNLPQDMPSEELAAKLWTFLDNKLGNKQSYTNHRVVDVQIVLPNKLIAFSRMFGDIIREKNTLMREFVQLFAPGYPGKQIDYAGVKALLVQLKEKHSPNLKEATALFKQIREKSTQKFKLLSQIQKLRTSKHIRIVCAFVTFSSVPARNRILDKFSSSSFDRFARILCSCCYTKDLSFQGKLIYAKSSDDPSSILWENLGEPGLIIFFRRMGSFFLTVAMWVISGGILLVSTYYKNYFKNEYPTIDCTNLDPSKTQVSADYAMGSLQTGLLECYCSQDIIGRLSHVFPASDDDKLCQTWFKDKVTMLSITFAIVFGVIIINFAIQFIFQGLSKFEKHSTLNKQLAQRVLKTFVAQFLNTGILILLVNAKIKEISFWQGKFADISPLWYENVGSTLLSTMFINIFTIPAIRLAGVLYNKMRSFCDRGCTQDLSKTKKKTQPDYEQLYMGPEFIIDFRYSQILTLTFVCFLYSGGMPFLYITSFVQLIVTYYFDKLFLLRICKLPKNYDEKLEQVVRLTMYGIIVLHLGFTIFMYGNGKIFNQELSSFSALTTTVGSIGDTISENSENVILRWFNRCKIGHNLPLVIALIVIVAVFFVKGFLLDFVRRTLFAVFFKEEDANRKQIKKKNGKAESTYTFFSVIQSEDIATLIRLTKVTLKTTQNENLMALLKKKLLLLKQQYQVRKQDEDTNQVDPNINFIGFFSYDVRLNPMYKNQFAIEEQLDDEDLN